jgi:hypothetical protein
MLERRIMNLLSESSTTLLVLAAAILATAPGCSTKDFKPSKIFSLDNAWPFEDDEPEEGVPVRIVGAWTDTVMTVPGQKAQRGFGGRLMFYGAKDEKPILVDGQLVVYAFDETGRAPSDNKPTRRYVFPPDQMKLRMSESDIGASYSFWLPWDEAGGPKTEVSLICRFEPKGGAVITGEQTRHILPGAIAAASAVTPGAAPRVPEGVPMRPAQMTLQNLQTQRQVPSGVQTANYETVVEPQAAAAAALPTTGAGGLGRQMSVTSIALPNDFQLPDGVTPMPIASASNLAGRNTQAPQPAQAVPYQQQYAQPASAMQPAAQTAQPPVINGAAVMQQMPVGQSQLPPPNAIPQRPMMSPANMAGVYVPQNQGFVAPISTQPGIAQQPLMAPAGGAMAVPAGPTVQMPQQQVGMMPQQPMAAMATQQMTPIPAQQMVPQQGYQQPAYQQLPTANGVRTAVSYGPPTAIPWR